METTHFNRETTMLNLGALMMNGGFNIINNDIVLTAKAAPCDEIHQESP